jgi:hypothetical protein
MWTYSQREGWFGKDGVLLAWGYSGREQGLNEPEFQYTIGIGPIPRGIWHVGHPIDTEDHGPFVLPLSPDTEEQLHSRMGFLIHGDNKKGDNSASHGCIILAHFARHRIWDSMDRILQVVETIKGEDQLWPNG